VCKNIIGSTDVLTRGVTRWNSPQIIIIIIIEYNYNN
jgi:hypothetical protein